MSKTLGFYNLTGGLNTVQDLATINSTTNRTESPDMLNVEYYKLGGIQTMKGNKRLGKVNDFTNVNGTEYGDIICGIEYILANKAYMVVADKLGYIYEYDKTNKEFKPIIVDDTLEDPDERYLKFHFQYIDPDAERPELDTDFYDNERIYAVPYNNGIVFVNGKEALYYNHDKPEMNKVWTPVLSIEDNNETVETTFYPVCVASYRGRLFFGANVAEQEDTTYEGGMLFYSGVGLGIPQEDPDNPGSYLPWQESANVGEDAGAFKEFFEDSSNFTGLGTWAEYLVIHKEQNTYLLDGTADLADSWQLKPYSEYTVPSQQSYVIANNGYYTYVPEAGGIYPLLSRSIYNNMYQGGDLSVKIKDSFDLIDTLNYSKIYTTYHAKKKYIMFYIPTLDGNGSNNCFIYDINTKTWLHRRVPQYVTCAFKYNNEVYIGVKDTETNHVKVLKEFSGKTFDGTSIEFHYVTPPFIWGGGTNKTTTKEFRVKLINSSANHFYIESLRDGLMDSKAQRLIKNVNDNLDGLIWDIGLSQYDRLYDNSYITADFYEYTVGDNKYYAKVDNTHIVDTTKIYGDIQEVDVNGSTRYILTNFLNYYKYFRVNTLIPSTSSDYDTIRYNLKPSYAWNEQVKGSFCYKNGKYYAWVDQTTGLCTTNLEYQDWYQWYGIKLTGGEGSPQRFRVSESVLNDINTKLNKTATQWTTKDYPHDMQYYYYNDGSWKTNTWVLAGQTWYSALYTMMQYGKYVDDGLNMSLYMNGSMIQRYQGNTWKGKSKIPESAWKDNPDTVKGNKKNNEVPTGTKPLSITKGTKATGEQASITISVKIKGVSQNITLTRYSAGDLGKRNGDTNYYTKTLTNGTAQVYLDSACETQDENHLTGSISGDTLTYNSLSLTRYSQGDGQWKDPAYYKYTDLTSVVPTTIDGAEEIYHYPDDSDPVWEQTLTDTVWDYSNVDEPYIVDNRPVTRAGVKEGEKLGNTYEDMSLSDGVPGDAWLQQGYQTKRMLLPDQYFETIQFRFSGGGYDKDGNERYSDSICIGGFEVDGIQLAETPWK